MKPHGTEAAGWPVMLNGNVNGIQAYGGTDFPAISVGLSSPIAKGGHAIVGVRSRSYFSKSRRGCSHHASRSNQACTYFVGGFFSVVSMIR